MARTKMVLAGEGGQGVQSIAKFLLKLAMKQANKFYISQTSALNNVAGFLSHFVKSQTNKSVNRVLQRVILL